MDDAFARQQVMSRLTNVDLPDGVKPDVQPPYGPTGEIFRYTLKSPTKSILELSTIQNWVLDRQFKSVPGVADVNSFGGAERSFEVSVNPDLLIKYNLTAPDVYAAMTKSNINVGGDVIEKNGQAYVVRGIGLLDNISDIENIIIDNINGTPILVKNVAEVKESYAPRVGQAGKDHSDDVMEGIIVMRKGENPSEVLARVKDKINDLNTNVLPSDVKIVTFYDRDNLMQFCTETVLHNLLEGIILVTVIVLVFMADWRTTVIVSIIIPLALLFAFIYIPTGNTLTIKLGTIDGAKVKAWWFDPRTGKGTLIGEYENKGEQEFQVPGMSKELSWLKSGRGCDWVLVLDDASKGFTEPGK